jgi:hypothetical protein
MYQLKITTERITPKQAEKYLEENIENNRPILDRHVAVLARDMKAGNWVQNGETIKFNGTGALLDGQHRLWGCIEAQVPFTTAVARGVPSLEEVDRGRSRAMSHILAMRQVKNAIKVSVAIRTIWRWENTNWRASQIIPSTRESLELLDSYPVIEEITKISTRIRKIEGSSEICALACWRLTQLAGLDTARSVFERLSQKKWDSLEDPLFRYHVMVRGAKVGIRNPGYGLFLRWNLSQELRRLTGEPKQGIGRK